MRALVSMSFSSDIEARLAEVSGTVASCIVLVAGVRHVGSLDLSPESHALGIAAVAALALMTVGVGLLGGIRARLST